MFGGEDMKKKWQIVLAGEGGQGMIVAGVALAEAAAVFEGKNATQAQSYGIASRGGFSSAEVVINEGEIFYPKAEEPDFVLALTQDAYNRFYNWVSPECLIVYDSDRVTSKRGANDLGYPLSVTSVRLGSEKLINSLSLGLVLKHTRCVKPESLEKALAKQLPEKAMGANVKALGYWQE